MARVDVNEKLEVTYWLEPNMRLIEFLLCTFERDVDYSRG